MSDQPSEPPTFEEWLEAERLREREETIIRCPCCGTGMPTMLTDSTKPYNQGRFYWWCPEETCLKKWESRYGQLVPRQLTEGEK